MKELAILQIALAKGVGDVLLKKIISFLDSTPHTTWCDLCSSPKDVAKLFKLKPEIAENIASSENKAKITYEKLLNHDIKILLENDSIYPNKLKNALGNCCPPVLFAKGNISLLNSKAVGFCGSRKVSSKGLNITEECARQLVGKDLVVISGYAAGTDLAAHRSALSQGGNTIFVLAEGILKYSKKSEIKELLSEHNHVFVSQFAPELTWNAGNAMKRNKTIIGLSSAMILVESGKTGGTFAAGEETLKVGYPLFVIDFSQPEVSAEANPYFIGKGGIPIRGNKEGTPNLRKLFDTVYNSTNAVQPKLPNDNFQLTLIN